MARKIGEHYDANGIKETWWDNGDGNVTVQRSQDAQAAADLVQTVNAEGVPTHDGLGKPVAELPQIVWMEYCAQRGLDWTKLFSTHEMDDEFKRCAAEHKRFKFDNTRSVHTVQ
jgi:hypothetical protein